MFQYFTPFLILQAACLFHAYRNNVDQRWYWLIIFIPGIGSVLYLFNMFYSRRNIQSISEGMKVVVNSNYRIEQLEKAHKFSPTITSKTQLADAYVTIGRYEDAIQLYRDCLSGYLAEDPRLRMKLLNASFLSGDHATAVEYGGLLDGEKTFKNAPERIAFAWSLHYSGNTAQAAQTFKDMDRSFTNFRHRVEYCKFLIATNQNDVLISTLTELREELEHMKGPELRLHRTEIREIKGLCAQHIRD